MGLSCWYVSEAVFVFPGAAATGFLGFEDSPNASSSELSTSIAVGAAESALSSIEASGFFFDAAALGAFAALGAAGFLDSLVAVEAFLA